MAFCEQRRRTRNKPMYIHYCNMKLPDGLTRRGDINVLLLGDPGISYWCVYIG
ncbi:hypothetical protein ANCCAN_30177 [Ancylostoma caninum]|uniref:Uncharacterized protein n=1 Tax=Ancylostoma caninum TaxID=29170 RepID=A0A368EWN2_ANCCA|nr:hypothetical protein ANCCAN_30177 [Ancylostoma caninum]